MPTKSTICLRENADTSCVQLLNVPATDALVSAPSFDAIFVPVVPSYTAFTLRQLNRARPARFDNRAGSRLHWSYVTVLELLTRRRRLTQTNHAVEQWRAREPTKKLTTVRQEPIEATPRERVTPYSHNRTAKSKHGGLFIFSIYL